MKKTTPTYIINPPSKFSLQIKELWEYRELLYMITWRDIKVKYNQTFLGILWVLLQPILLMLVFIFFLSRSLPTNTEEIPPAIFYLSGLIAWNMFNKAVLGAGNSIIYSADLINKIFFPRLILPLSNVFSALYDYSISFSLYLLIVLYYGYIGMPIQLISFIIYSFTGSVLLMITSIGMGTLLASINIQYRDASYILPFFLQLLFFLSPIIYSINSISETWVKYLLAINPLTSVILLLRAPFATTIPDSNIFLISTLSSLVILSLGIYNFKKKESFFAELI